MKMYLIAFFIAFVASADADVNGSLNILRKEIGNGFISKLNRGCVKHQIKAMSL